MRPSIIHPDKEVPDLRVARHAGQFADAAFFLYEHMAQIHCWPSVLLEATLAIELYLKALNSRTIYHPLDNSSGIGFLLTTEPAKRLHLLQDLFDAIDRPIQEDLQKAYTAAAVVPGVLLLRDALGSYNNLFVDIRYIFERKEWTGHSMTALMDILKFMRQYVGSMPVSHLNG